MSFIVVTYLAPTAAPVNVQAWPTSSRAVIVAWQVLVFVLNNNNNNNNSNNKSHLYIAVKTLDA